MPSTRKPPKLPERIPVKELAALQGRERELRELSELLDIPQKSPEARALAEDVHRWILTYWRWRKNEQLAPNAQHEIVLLEGLAKKIIDSVEKCNLSVGTEDAMLAAGACLAARIEQLRETPPPRGRRRDIAMRNLAPLLNHICLSHKERATPKQRRDFAAAVCHFANIPFPDPDSHRDRADKLLRGTWVGPPPFRPEDVIALAEKAKGARE